MSKQEGGTGGGRRKGGGRGRKGEKGKREKGEKEEGERRKGGGRKEKGRKGGREKGERVREKGEMDPLYPSQQAYHKEWSYVILRGKDLCSTTSYVFESDLLNCLSYFSRQCWDCTAFNPRGFVGLLSASSAVFPAIERFDVAVRHSLPTTGINWP